MQETDKSFIAGFLDGDGSIYVRLKPNKDYKYNFQVAPYIVFYQGDKQISILKHIKKLLGIGYLRYRKDGIVEYTIGDIDGLRKLINVVEPYLVLKKQRLILLRRILDKKETVSSANDFLELAKLIDQFADLNYSAKRTVDSKKVRAELKSKGLL